MIWAMVKKELFQRRWAIFGFTLASLLFLLMYMSIYPSFQNETAKFDELLKSYPKAILEAFNIEQLSLSTVEGYISAEHFSFIWPLMAIFLALSSAGTTIAGEIEKGTMAFLLSQPLSRTRIFISKYISALLGLAIFIAASTVAIIPLASLLNLQVSTGNIYRVTLLSSCFVWAVYSLGLLVSCVFSERSKVYFSVGGLLVLMYVANIMSGLISSLDKLKYLSFFHYFSPDKALVAGQLYASSFYVFIGVAVVATIGGIVIFKRRDISV